LALLYRLPSQNVSLENVAVALKMLETKQGVIIELYVKPHSKEFSLATEDDGLVVSSREPPVKGRVNKELMKELSKLFQANVQIISGQTSKRKRILISGVSAAKVNYVLSKFPSERRQ
jgi:uncharacterized protein (TIGR00251 family)